ncbi:kinase-like domain-containing protein [Chaetomium strumarium]|uniref:Kinase-like domain-containing protein n=1 Tax=Chaetomium strumarium TaxID=1170767 RepID=A0AAJ0GRI0_9PEZI|nr:kinase-like domain-containing protein [Chaetomium strumarium]
MEDGPCYFGLDRVSAEDPEHYYRGGYCPVDIGDHIGRFKIVHKLGHGGFATVWLARENNKPGLVALKIVAADYSQTYEKLPEIASLLRSFPTLFVAERERFFVDSPNGHHLCQVLPVLGPTLEALIDSHHRLYPEYVRDFARQITSAVEVMHSSGLCHGGKDMGDVPPKRQEIKRRSASKPKQPGPRAPNYAVEAMDLTRLPSKYLSSKLYILDFDQAYLSHSPPRSLLGIPPRYLAPESIFEVRNGPPADIWALGCLIFRMRCGVELFGDLFESPSNTIAKMYAILGGHFPTRWKQVQFGDDGWPAHDGLQEGVGHHNFSGNYSFSDPSLREYVSSAIDVKRSKTVGHDIGIEKFCRYLPRDAFCRRGQLTQAWTAANSTQISQKEADSFYGLMRGLFEYNYTKRITASGMLGHTWFRGG